MLETFLTDLSDNRPELVAQKWIIDRTPHIFAGDQSAYVSWKSILANAIEVDGRAITLIGSASVGFSLSPTKEFRAFHDGSDIDIAVISAYHFDVAWRVIRSLGASYHSLSRQQQSSVEDHQKRLIYWGTFDTKHLLPKLPFAKQWFKAFESMTTFDPTRDRDINARIYRDFESLSAYHASNLRKLRNLQKEE